MAATAVGNQEIFNAYLLWGRDNYDLVFFGQTMPTTWLISLDAIISTVTVAGALVFWTVWAKFRKEPDEIIKLAIGALIAAGAPLILAAASAQQAATGEKASLIWGIGFHVVNDIGFANIMPVGLALYSRTAPRGLQGVMIGIYYLHLFFGNIFVGWLAGLLEVLPGSQFWGLHAVLVAAAGVSLLVVKLVFGRLLAPDATPTAR